MQNFLRFLEVFFVFSMIYGCSAQATQGHQPSPELQKDGGRSGGRESKSQQPAGLMDDRDKDPRLLKIPIKSADGSEAVLKWSGREMLGNDRFEVVAGQ